MGVERERERRRTQNADRGSPCKYFFCFKIFTGDFEPLLLNCIGMDKKGLAWGGWTKWEKADRQPVGGRKGYCFTFFFLVLSPSISRGPFSAR